MNLTIENIKEDIAGFESRITEAKAELAALPTGRDTWQERAKELDKYIETREGQYRVATKFDQLFMLVANPKQVMDFKKLEEYIKDKKGFFEKVEGGEE